MYVFFFYKNQNNSHLNSFCKQNKKNQTHLLFKIALLQSLTYIVVVNIAMPLFNICIWEYSKEAKFLIVGLESLTQKIETSKVTHQILQQSSAIA